MSATERDIQAGYNTAERQHEAAGPVTDVEREWVRRDNEARRLNALAALVQAQRHDFVPLSVRHRAARAADAIVAEHFRSRPSHVSEETPAEGTNA